MIMLVSALSITFLLLLIFVILVGTISTSRRVNHRVHSGISYQHSPIFAFVCVLVFVYF